MASLVFIYRNNYIWEIIIIIKILWSSFIFLNYYNNYIFVLIPCVIFESNKKAWKSGGTVKGKEFLKNSVGCNLRNVLVKYMISKFLYVKAKGERLKGSVWKNIDQNGIGTHDLRLIPDALTIWATI